MKQETFKEAAEREYPERHGLVSKDILSIIKQEAFINGATWQKDQFTIEEQYMGHSIDDLDKSYMKGFNEGAEWQKTEMEYFAINFSEWCCAKNMGVNKFTLYEKELELYKKEKNL